MIFVLISAYNEEQGLRAILPRIPSTISGHRINVVVMSDGSTDNTVQIADRHGCHTIVSAHNRGKGATMRSGMAYVENRSFGAAVFMDADGQHDPGDLPQLLAPILEGTADIAIGSRYIDASGRGAAPRNRYFVRTVTVALLRRILSISVTDPYSGYRVLSGNAMQCIDLVGDRYESELEMLFCAGRGDLHVVELPITKVYGAGTSKMGSRRGAFLGRIDVVVRYAMTIARQSRRTAKVRPTDKREATAA